MASAQPADEPATASPSIENTVDGVNGLKLDEQPAVTGETQQGGQSEKPQEGESQLAMLHRLCAEGDVMGVRAILSQGLDLLESIGEFFLLRCEALSLVAGHSLRNISAQIWTKPVKSRGLIGHARSEKSGRKTAQASVNTGCRLQSSKTEGRHCRLAWRLGRAYLFSPLRTSQTSSATVTDTGGRFLSSSRFCHRLDSNAASDLRRSG